MTKKMITNDPVRRCVVCRRTELPVTYAQTCPRCAGRIGEDLRAIVRLHQLISAELEGRAGAANSGQGGNGIRDDNPLPHVDLLTLIGPGSIGRGDRFAYPSDPPSVAFELSQWEDDWRHVLGMPAAERPVSIAAAGRWTVTRNQVGAKLWTWHPGFLAARLAWAAQAHPAFDEFAHDVEVLLRWLRAATRTGGGPERLSAPCFDCGGPLVRDYAPRRPTVPCEAQNGHARDQGGLRDDARCVACGRMYSPTAYALALRSLLEAHRERVGWGAA